MMKNVEWGSVAYLKQSEYGLGINDIGINNNSSYITSGGKNKYLTTKNLKMSTTGNMYGIYDMSGGVWEYVMGNLVNLSNAFNSSESRFINAPELKYYDAYNYDTSYTSHERGKLGDATKETLAHFGSDYTVPRGWYDDYSYFIQNTNNLFVRGGVYSDSDNVGLFTFHRYKGNSLSNSGSRSVLVIE